MPITMGKLRSPARSFKTIICWSTVSFMTIFESSASISMFAFAFAINLIEIYGFARLVIALRVL